MPGLGYRDAGALGYRAAGARLPGDWLPGDLWPGLPGGRGYRL